MKNSMKLALCGVMAALSTVLLFLTGAAPVATLALPAIAGCLLIPVVVEAGLPWAFGVYGVCSVLGVFLAPDRQALLFYVLFFGHYPALFAVLGRIALRRCGTRQSCWCSTPPWPWRCCFRCTCWASPLRASPFWAPWARCCWRCWPTWCSWCFDRALEGLIVQYLHRLHPRMAKILRGK